MKNLDQFIQEKKAEFANGELGKRVDALESFCRVHSFPSYEGVTIPEFLEATIRQTARETVEALKESIDKAVISEIPKFSTRQDARLATAMASEMKENCRTALLASAKERGIL